MSRKSRGKVDSADMGEMSKLTTIQSAADKAGVDSRKLAQALLAAGEKPEATLVSPKAEKPLFHAQKVEELAKSLVEAAKRRK
jgi:hypothetical protein